jgi:hypothetical protein
MKNLFKFLGATLVAASLMFTTACNPDKCQSPKKIECGAHGTCLDGLCGCDAGYEGTACDTLSRVKFVGSYSDFTESAVISGTTFDTNVSGFGIAASSTDETKVILTKFGGASNTVVATMQDKSTIKLPAGTVISVTDAGVTVNWTITSGTITNTGTNKIKMDYVLTAGTTTATCTVTMATRQ